ncbi:Survival of motor neuron-related-splicing factor 30 [Choanephora cucurbitarum]|uniref:Survival of motor neuron-related-splicing factor 30 n=1 Tax=Choanephora cucurbitarum TaxID=101091 RepID=A0A1C7N0W3_9FUNG|nr:Survival of motor neuron-related-splicing factor 30 [Choanephora cucurbitarum]
MSAEEIESYKFQLEQVELALQADPENDELQKLQNDLKELIAMFEAVTPTTPATPTVTSAGTQDSPAPKNKRKYDSEPTPPSTSTTALKLHEFSVDQEVLARWSGDGQFYKAIITAIGGADQVFSVKFKGYNDVEFVKAEDIKPIVDKKRPGIFEDVVDSSSKRKKKEAAPQATNASSSSSLGGHNNHSLPPTPAASLKKKKASEFESKKNAWLNFATGSSSSSKKKKTVAPVINKKSIFKTPDNPEGKVGVVGSGKGMTSFQQRGKHVYAPTGAEE